MTSATYKPHGPLVLPMKGKWYDMILSGEKMEEYRLFKPYWATRIMHWLVANGKSASAIGQHTVADHGTEFTWMYQDFGNKRLPILFVNGYSKDARRFIGWCDYFKIRQHVENPAWGECEYDGKSHFVLHISKVERIKE